MALKRRHEMGTGGRCTCPKCGKTLAHQQGVPCQDERCPGCGAKMLREGSYHHQLFKAKQAKKQRKFSGTPENEAS